MSIGRRRLRYRVDAVETQRTKAAGHSRLRCRSITRAIGVTAFTVGCTGSLRTLFFPPVRIARAMSGANSQDRPTCDSSTSRNAVDGYNSCGLDHPRTVDVIHDAFDPLPDHIETDG
jgi:hypothetical protein